MLLENERPALRAVQRKKKGCPLEGITQPPRPSHRATDHGCDPVTDLECRGLGDAALLAGCVNQLSLEDEVSDDSGIGRIHDSLNRVS
jgi:hypothetical protein